MKRNEKLLRFCRLLTSIIVLIAAVLKFCHIWPDALNLAIPLLDAFLYWKKDRDQAAVSLFTAGCIGLVCIGVFCM